MFCENCGKKLDESHKFCTKCGHLTSAISRKENEPIVDEKWWHRLMKIVYIVLYIPLPFLLILVWSENSRSYSYYLNRYEGSTGEAFWYSLLTFVIYVVIVRLVKFTFLYVAFAQKPQWKKEFKKFF